MTTPHDEQIAGLSDAQRALLEKWRSTGAKLEQRRAVTPQPPVATGRPSLQQEMMLDWLWERPQDSAGQNLSFATELIGALDAAALAGAMERLQARHDILRTTFGRQDGQWAVSVHDRRLGGLQTVDLEDQADGFAQARDDMSSRVSTPFDLAKGPLFSAVLYRLGPERHVLFLSVHHIIFDQWSMGVVIEELSADYTSLAAGAARPPADLPVQFADFALLERQWLEAGLYDPQKAFWRRTLGRTPSPRLRLAGAEQNDLAPQRRDLRVEFSTGLTEQVRAFARREGMTFHMVTIAALAIALRAATGEDEILIGTPVANRNYDNVDRLIGPFAKRVPLKIEMADGPDFRALMARARQASAEALANQSLPTPAFGAVLSELGAVDNTTIVYAFQNVPTPDFLLAGLTARPVMLDYSVTRADVTLCLLEADAMTGAGAEVGGVIYYNANRYPGAVIQALWVDFLAILAEAAKEG